MKKDVINKNWLIVLGILLIINLGYTIFRKKPTDKIEAGIEDIKDGVASTGLVVVIVALVLINHVAKSEKL